MPLHSTGTIKHSQIMGEFGHTGKFRLSADGAPLIDKAASTLIKESDFYGASDVPDPEMIDSPFKINLVISWMSNYIQNGKTGYDIKYMFPNAQKGDLILCYIAARKPGSEPHWATGMTNSRTPVWALAASSSYRYGLLAGNWDGVTQHCTIGNSGTQSAGLVFMCFRGVDIKKFNGTSKSSGSPNPPNWTVAGQFVIAMGGQYTVAVQDAVRAPSGFGSLAAINGTYGSDKATCMTAVKQTTDPNGSISSFYTGQSVWWGSITTVLG
jgi:hypothetical protein